MESGNQQGGAWQRHLGFNGGRTVARHSAVVRELCKEIDDPTYSTCSLLGGRHQRELPDEGVDHRETVNTKGAFIGLDGDPVSSDTGSPVCN